MNAATKLALFLCVAPIACSSGGAAGLSASSPGDDAAPPDAGSPPPPEAGEDSAPTVEASVDAGDDASDCATALPSSLACTGLYADLASKTIAPGVQAFVPAVPLWSDGSGKNRWVLLPPGTTIDRSSPNDWVFPAGTKFWKEFSRDGARLETRFFTKQTDGTWLWVSYQWDAAELSATAAPSGASVTLGDGAVYAIPSQEQCNECHSGRAEHVMGFEEVSLGMPGATGLTLAALASQGLLSPPPASTALAIGDDGSGDTAHALEWLHINCGVSCHSSVPTAGASSVSLRLRLDATQLDGGSAAGFDPLVTTVGVPSSTGLYGNVLRIAPGDPGGSLLVQLVSNRGAGKQMPPLASMYVDTADVAILSDWIAKMAPMGAVDGGSPSDAAGGPDASEDAGGDAGYDGAATPDAAPDGGAAGATDAGASPDGG